MRSVVMIPSRKYCNIEEHAREVTGSIRSPAQVFLASRTVETLSIGLFVFLVRAGNSMLVAIGAGLLGKRPVAFRPPIDLQDLNMSPKAPGQSGL